MQIYLRLFLNSIENIYFQNSNNEPHIINYEERKPMIFIGQNQSYIFIFYENIKFDDKENIMKFVNPKFYYIKPKDEKGKQGFEEFLANLKNSKDIDWELDNFDIEIEWNIIKDYKCFDEKPMWDPVNLTPYFIQFDHLQLLVYLDRFSGNSDNSISILHDFISNRFCYRKHEVNEKNFNDLIKMIDSCPEHGYGKIGILKKILLKRKKNENDPIQENSSKKKNISFKSFIIIFLITICFGIIFYLRNFYRNKKKKNRKRGEK